MRNHRFLSVLLCGWLLSAVVFSPHCAYASEMLQISRADLTKLEQNLEILSQNYQKQKTISANLTAQLTSASEQLNQAEASLTRLRASVDDELNKKLWIGVGVGAGATALITLITLLTTGIIK